MELARVRAQYDLDLEMERERRAQLVARQNALSSKLQAATARLDDLTRPHFGWRRAEARAATHDQWRQLRS